MEYDIEGREGVKSLDCFGNWAFRIRVKVVGARGRGKMVLALDAFGLKCLPRSQLERPFLERDPGFRGRRQRFRRLGCG